MPNCAVRSCRNSNKNTKGTGIRFFRFPRNEDLAKKWIVACRRDDEINLKNATVCSIHFEEKCIEIPMKQRMLNYSPNNVRLLTDVAVPTLNLLRCASDAGQKPISEPENDEQLISTLPIIERDNAELIELRQKVKMLESENQSVLSQIEDAKTATSEKYNLRLARVFTPAQIKRLLNPKARFRWSTENIASAISLRSVSPKAYRYLRANSYQLPAMSILRSWAGILMSMREF